MERLCEEAAACAGTYEASTCVDRLRSADRSSCDYDPRAAKDCMAALDEAQCVTVEPFGIDELAIPEPCEAVYDCEWLDFALEL